MPVILKKLVILIDDCIKENYISLLNSYIREKKIFFEKIKQDF